MSWQTFGTFGARVGSIEHTDGKEMSRLRVGVIGIGFGQQVHVPAFRSDKRCEVVAICASSEDRARRVATRLGIPKAYGDWHELVEDPEIDAVSVATPPTVQPAIAVAALEERKHVFCEKPMAPSLDVAHEMLLVANRSGSAHVIDFEFPEIEEWRCAKEILDGGVLGGLRHVQVEWHNENYAARAGTPSWKTRVEDGGGVLNGFVAHSFYYLEWLLGPIRQLDARLFSMAGSETRGETLAVLCLELVSRVPVSLSVSSNAFLGSGHRLAVYGDQGTLILENPTCDYVEGFRLFHGSRKGQRLLPVSTEYKPTKSGVDGRTGAVGRLVGRFVDWVQSGVPTEPNFNHGQRVQALLDAARASHGRSHWGVTV